MDSLEELREEIGKTSDPESLNRIYFLIASQLHVNLGDPKIRSDEKIFEDKKKEVIDNYRKSLFYSDNNVETRIYFSYFILEFKYDRKEIKHLLRPFLENDYSKVSPRISLAVAEFRQRRNEEDMQQALREDWNMIKHELPEYWDNFRLLNLGVAYLIENQPDVAFAYFDEAFSSPYSKVLLLPTILPFTLLTRIQYKMTIEDMNRFIRYYAKFPYYNRYNKQIEAVFSSMV